MLKFNGNNVSSVKFNNQEVDKVLFNGNVVFEKSRIVNLLQDLNHKIGTTETVSGVTAVYNQDGSITLNGTSTAQADFYVEGTGLGVANAAKKIYKSGEYTLRRTDNHKVILYVVWYDSTNKVITQTYAITTDVTFTIPVDTVKVRTFLRIQNANKSFDNVTIYPMIVEGHNMPEKYVPYN